MNLCFLKWVFPLKNLQYKNTVKVTGIPIVSTSYTVVSASCNVDFVIVYCWLNILYYCFNILNSYREQTNVKSCELHVKFLREFTRRSFWSFKGSFLCVFFRVLYGIIIWYLLTILMSLMGKIITLILIALKVKILLTRLLMPDMVVYLIDLH